MHNPKINVHNPIGNMKLLCPKVQKCRRPSFYLLTYVYKPSQRYRYLCFSLKNDSWSSSMSHPSLLAAADFNYHLPEEKIAFRPTEKRDDSRLLVYHKGNITDSTFLNLPAQLPPGSLLIFNDTKVVEARLIFKKDSGSTIEIFCLAPGEEYPDITTGLARHGTVKWQCLVGGASKWKPGQILTKILKVNNEDVELYATYKSKVLDAFAISFSPISLYVT